MDFNPTPDQRKLRQEIVDFARRELNQGISDRDHRHAFSFEEWKKCGGLRLQGLPVPSEYGGRSLDPLSLAVGLEALGYGCHDGGLVFSICAHLLACTIPVWKHGSEEQKRRYLPGLCDGTLIAANAMTEPDAGSDVFALKTKAKPVDGGYLLSGSKTFITNAPIADVAIVFAVTDAEKGFHGGLSAFIIDKDVDGLDLKRGMEKVGLRTSPFGEVLLQDVFVPHDALLGQPGSGGMLFAEAMDWERICLFASNLGIMERLLEKAIATARTRTMFGQPLGKNQSVSHKLVDLKIQLEAARLLTYRAASRLDKVRTVTMDASMAKLIVSESLLRTALETVTLCGMEGCLETNDALRSLRDALACTIYSGTSEMQRNIVARWLGL